MNEPGPCEYVLPLELARVIGITPQVIYNYIRTGRIKHELVNGKIVIPITAANEYLNKRFEKEKRKHEQIERELNGL